MRRPILERVLDKVEIDPTTECWNFTGSKWGGGYGAIGVEAGRGPACTHRVVYEEVVGPIPVGLDLDHLCRNRACCNPDHLEPVTRRENVRRGVGPLAVHAAKTHCIHGHPFDEANTYKTKAGRHCRACRAATNRRRHQRRTQ